METVKIEDTHDSSDPRLTANVEGTIRSGVAELVGTRVNSASCVATTVAEHNIIASVRLDAAVAKTTPSGKISLAASLRLDDTAHMHVVGSTRMQVKCEVDLTAYYLHAVPVPVHLTREFEVDPSLYLWGVLPAGGDWWRNGLRTGFANQTLVLASKPDPFPGVAGLNLTKRLGFPATLSASLHSPRAALLEAQPRLRSFVVAGSVVTHTATIRFDSQNFGRYVNTASTLEIGGGGVDGGLDLLQQDCLSLHATIRSNAPELMPPPKPRADHARSLTAASPSRELLAALKEVAPSAVAAVAAHHSRRPSVGLLNLLVRNTVV